MITYESWPSFAQTWGTVGFVASFVLAARSTRSTQEPRRFDEAARLPLEKD